MNKRNKNISLMFAQGYRPEDSCEWIDAYNKTVLRGGAMRNNTDRDKQQEYALYISRVMKEHRLFNLYGEDRGTGFAGNVWDIKGLCPTITTMGGGQQATNSND